MAEYLSPGVYVEDNPNPPVIEAVSSSTGGFMGVAQRGKVNVPTFITSWSAYLREFAYGMNTPFLDNSDLAYAVFGFFQNGGKRCYIMRVAGDSNAVANADFSSSGASTSPVIKAKDEGAWGNELKLQIKANADITTNFDMILKRGSIELEVFTNVSNKADDEMYWKDFINFNSMFIKGISGDLSVTTTDATFKDGNDGESVSDTTFTNNLLKWDNIDDVNLLALPGQTSKNVHSAVMSYCENRKDVFALLDAPKTSTTTSVKELRKTMSCKNAGLYFPYIRVINPNSKQGKLRDCPPSGHVMGVYARTITERGVWKAPAGTEAIVRGAVEVVTTLTTGDTDILNPAGIISIMPKPNYGIVIWGARTLHPDSSMKYVSDVLLDIMIKKSVFLGTQSFVFEPNDHKTWTRVIATIQSFLDLLWRDGALFGEKPEQAYFVKCDEDLNPMNSRNAGRLICEVGYANKKPAEFVIFRFSHQVNVSS